jgi:hypothetical protein
MSPRRTIRRQCAPPSWVAYSPGPNSQPDRALANTTPLTRDACLKLLTVLLESSTSGMFRKCQCAPPSVVAASRARHALPPAQPTPPSATPRVADRKLTETGSNLAGGDGVIAMATG